VLLVYSHGFFDITVQAYILVCVCVLMGHATRGRSISPYRLHRHLSEVIGSIVAVVNMASTETAVACGDREANALYNETQEGELYFYKEAKIGNESR
jgi:hypothetical protein